MYLKILGILLSTLLFAGCAGGPVGDEAGSVMATDEAAAAELAATDPNRLVCIRYKKTGTHMHSKICHTAQDWETARKESQEAMRDVQQGQRSCVGCTGD